VTKSARVALRLQQPGRSLAVYVAERLADILREEYAKKNIYMIPFEVYQAA
jgi:hypothetical protein